MTPVFRPSASAPSEVERNFGDSARQMVWQQTFDRSAESQPITPPALDGQKGEQVLGDHRSDVAGKDEVSNEIIFNVGN